MDTFNSGSWAFYESPKDIFLKEKLDSELIDSIKQVVPETVSWVVQEKVTGIQTAIIYDEQTTRYALRPKDYEMLPELHDVIKNSLFELDEKISKLFTETGAKEHVVVYGEIIGGSYPHENIEETPESIKLFNDTHYSPSNKFLAYDLCIDEKFVSTAEATGYFNSVGLLHAAMLLIANLDECLNFSAKFETTIPDQIDQLPKIDNNFCQGIIIRPEELYNDSEGERILLKKTRD